MANSFFGGRTQFRNKFTAGAAVVPVKDPFGRKEYGLCLLIKILKHIRPDPNLKNTEWNTGGGKHGEECDGKLKIFR